jgi:hypothetical protein
MAGYPNDPNGMAGWRFYDLVRETAVMIMVIIMKLNSRAAKNASKRLN